MTRSPLPNSRRILALALLCAGVLFSGCRKEESPLPSPSPPPQKQQVAAPKNVPVQKVASSASKLPTVPVNQFDFSSKKDPFKPYVVVKPVQKVTQEESRKPAARDSLPIHSFDVSQFRVIGIVTDARGNQAMVVDPTGKGYVLKVGMTIGKNDGRVTSISSAGVDVLEQFRDDNGRVRKENIRITLPRKQ